MAPEDQEWSDLTWGKYRETQNVHYLHGALQFFDDGVSIIKETYDSRSFLLEKVSARMEKGEYPIFVTAGDGRQKLKHIMHNRYLTHCFESLCAANWLLGDLRVQLWALRSSPNRSRQQSGQIWPKECTRGAAQYLYWGVLTRGPTAHRIDCGQVQV